MDLFFCLGVLILLFLGVIMCDELNDRFKRIPFGPVRVPIIGNWHQLYFHDSEYMYKALTKLAAIHGNLMKVWFGFVGSVVISGYEKITSVLNSDDWVGLQDDTWLLDRTTKSTRDLTARENADSIRMWASARMFANRCLADKGFSRDKNLDAILTTKSADLCGLVQYWKDQNMMNIEMDNFFLPFAASINWTSVTGEIITVEDARIQELLKLIKNWEEVTVETSYYLDYWPVLADWYPERIGFDKLRDVNQQIRRFLQNLIQEYRATGNYANSPNNLIEKFLEKIEENNGIHDKKSSEITFTDATLVAVLFNILFPSTLVLQSTLNFGLLLIGKNKEVQERIRTEIATVTGNQNRPLCVDELAKLPYLNATVLEVYRVANVIPFERRKILKTVREEDTRVTQGMTLIFNYDSGNFDPKMWVEPTSFNPDRFLDANGKTVDEIKLLAIIAAKRLCIGEVYSRRVVMHALSSLLQKFNFKLRNNNMSARPMWGIINKPSPYEILVT